MKIGKLITNPMRIKELADNHKAVYVKAWKKHSPAAWIINMNCGFICSWIKSKQFYEIKK